MKSDRISNVRDILSLTVILAVAGIVLWLMFKLIDNFTVLWKKVSVGLGNIEEKINRTGTVLSPLATEEEKQTALLGETVAQTVASDPVKAGYVYDASLDTRKWYEKLYMMPPASAFRPMTLAERQFSQGYGGIN